MLSMRRDKVLANLVEFKLMEFKEIDTPIKTLENKTICKLIIDLKSIRKYHFFTLNFTSNIARCILRW